MNPVISNWAGQRVWIIGASSGIGAETAKLLLQRGARVALSARRVDLLQAVANFHPRSVVAGLDLTDPASVQAAYAQIAMEWQGVDMVLIVAGSYNEMRADNFDLAIARNMLELNLHGPLNCLDVVLPGLLTQGHGSIGIVSSVAGYSGLPKALIYGPSKAALINLCESLYLDLRPRGIGVYMINPGFVATALTAGNDFPMPALMKAPDAAREIVRGMERGEFHIHFPKRLSNVLRVLRMLPYRLYFWIIHKGTGL